MHFQQSAASMSIGALACFRGLIFARLTPMKCKAIEDAEDLTRGGKKITN